MGSRCPLGVAKVSVFYESPVPPPTDLRPAIVDPCTSFYRARTLDQGPRFAVSKTLRKGSQDSLELNLRLVPGAENQFDLADWSHPAVPHTAGTGSHCRQADKPTRRDTCSAVAHPRCHRDCRDLPRGAQAFNPPPSVPKAAHAVSGEETRHCRPNWSERTWKRRAPRSRSPTSSSCSR